MTAAATSQPAESFSAINQAPHTPTSLSSQPGTAVTVTTARDSPRITKTGHTDLTLPLARASLSPRISHKSLSPRSSPQPLTGVVAVTDARRKRKTPVTPPQTSPNPQAAALNALMGSAGMTKASDAPTPSRLSEPMQKAAEKITTVPSAGDRPQKSPQGAKARPTATNGVPAAITITATGDDGPHFTAEPGDIDDDTTSAGGDSQLAPPKDDDERQAFTYPGPRPVSVNQDDSARGMSLPGAGYDQNSPKSSGARRHKCPYCSTDFTRHHNLKSHLLTHSQEKPYVCQTCSARFRRLHDLKRHSKLHTGERPHTCPKCGRRFARGDALARHNKGPGGCAGRRASFGGDDDGDGGGDDSMEGIEYRDGDDRDDDSEMLDASGRRVSEPVNKRARLETPQDASRQVYRQHSSTYPPPLGRSLRQEVGSKGSHAPTEHNTHGHSANSSYSSQYHPPPPGSVFAPGHISESPRPLSPGQQRHGAESGSLNKSPSLATQFQQQHFGRSRGGSNAPPPPQAHMSSHAPQLPSLPGLAPNHQPSTRMGHPSSMPMGASNAAGHHGSNPSSMSSHGPSSGGSMRDILGHDPQELWAYVRNLEQRFSRMQDEYELRISRLQEDLISLKGQLYPGR